MLFNLFKRRNKNTVLSEDDKLWNKMWELWANGEISSPYNELMNYHGEVNNGGHSQYFVNTENTSDIEKEMSLLNEILPCNLKENLQKAYQAHLLLEQDETNEEAETLLRKCDNIFFENEEDINNILKNFSKNI